MDEFSSREEFSGAQGRALHFILAQTGDVFQKDIEEEYGIRPPTASQLLKQMERNGLIRREAVPYDNRLKKIIATDKAMSYKKQVMEDVASLEADLTRGISEEQLENFLEVIQIMLDNLSN